MRRGRAGPDRVSGGEDLVVPDGLEQPEGRLVLGLGLAAEADDDVGRDRDPRDRLTDSIEALAIARDAVLPAHSPQDRVVARLDREVEGLADRRAVGHGLDEPVREVPRV